MSEQTARVVQINVNPAGGVPKLPVPEALVTTEGVRGDYQRDREHHGGPQRAVSLYALELIEALQQEGHPISAGSTGENLTVKGLDWAGLRPGVRLYVGAELALEITAYAAPCATIRESFNDGNFKRIGQKPNPGWSRLYARVLIEGQVREGDPVVVED